MSASPPCAAIAAEILNWRGPKPKTGVQAAARAASHVAKMRADVRANVEREVKKRVEARVKNQVMQALIDSTPVEVPKSLIEMEAGRMVQSARADLQARGIKMEQLPIEPSVFETQARRRVTLGLLIGEVVKVLGDTSIYELAAH